MSNAFERDAYDALANARLIAAAPDLLAACEMSLKVAEILYDEHPGHYGPHEWRDDLRAAIAKAKPAEPGRETV